MPSTVTNRHRIRHSFGHIQAPLLVPHLLKIQLDSYERFLQREVPPDQRKDEGLEAVFRSVFPISDFSGSSTLEYVHYRLCLLYTSPSPRDLVISRMPSSA